MQYIPIYKNPSLKQNEARNLNHLEVVEEDKRSKLPSNHEAKKARIEWQLKEEEARKVKCRCSCMSA